MLTFLTLTTHPSSAQKLHLIIKGKDTSETKKIDSLGYQKEFNSYESLQAINDSILKRTHKAGYVEAFAEKIRQKNDTTFLSTLSLGKQYLYIKVFYKKKHPSLFRSKSDLPQGNVQLFYTYGHRNGKKHDFFEQPDCQPGATFSFP